MIVTNGEQCMTGTIEQSFNSKAFVHPAPTSSTNRSGRTRVAIQTSAYELSIGGTIPDDFQNTDI